MAVDETLQTFDHPLYSFLGKVPGLSIAMTTADIVLTWGLQHSLWAFPMATSCCGIEFMATMTSRFDMDQFGTFTRPVPRQSDVFVVAGTITVKMAPRVKKLWDQMPEPKWCVAMGSCAISGDFYRDIYSVVPGVDTFIPVDVYVPGCPPAPDHLHMGMHKLAEMIRLKRAGKFDIEKHRAERPVMIKPSIPMIGDPDRDPLIDEAQLERTLEMDPGCMSRLPGQMIDLSGETIDREGVSLKKKEEELMSERVPAEVIELFKAHGVTDVPPEGPTLPVKQLLEVAQALKDAGYYYFVYCAAAHYPESKDGPERIDVAYRVRKVGPGSHTVPFKVSVSPSQAVPSLWKIWAGADWEEREQFDLVGVTFSGHPDLRRIMLPEDWKGNPLRRDYAIDTPHFPWR